MAERDLIVAIIDRAINDVTINIDDLPEKKQLEARYNKIDAKKWINKEGITPGSFEWYCFLIDMEPIKIRKTIAEQYISE